MKFLTVLALLGLACTGDALRINSTPHEQAPTITPKPATGTPSATSPVQPKSVTTTTTVSAPVEDE